MERPRQVNDDHPDTDRSLFAPFAKHTSTNLLREFGHALAEQRTDRGLTQTAVAHRAGITQAALSQIENGLINPNLTTVVAIAYALQMQPAQLLATTTRPPHQERP
jgi:DNA-binding XRE family transcriptional regulator